MGEALSSIFGGGGSSEAEDLARKQAAELDKKKAKEQEKKDAQLAVLAGIQGRGGSPTLFRDTGARGVSEVLG